MLRDCGGYQRATGERSARRVGDERLSARIREVHEQNFEAYGYPQNAQLELATVAYVGWFNNRRLHSSIGNRPPVEHERDYWGAGRARV